MIIRPPIPRETQREIFVQAGHRCAACGTPFPLERAHIVPWSKTHDHSPENLICLCANCHERADKDWDEKTLREYKQRPWVNRQDQPSDIVVTKKVLIEIDAEFEHWNEVQERWLKFGIASFLNVPPSSVKIVNAEEGSVRVTIVLPKDLAEKLELAIAHRDKQLQTYIEPLQMKSMGKHKHTSDYSEEETSTKSRDRKANPSTEIKVYVGNLPYSISKEELREVFEEFGVVSELSIPTDRHTGNTKGFAFVTLNSHKAANEVVASLNTKKVAGRLIRVTHSQNEPSHQSGTTIRPKGDSDIF